MLRDTTVPPQNGRMVINRRRFQCCRDSGSVVAMATALNESSLTNLQDLCAPTLHEGRYSSGLGTDGVPGYITSPSSPGLRAGRPFQKEVWLPQVPQRSAIRISLTNRVSVRPVTDRNTAWKWLRLMHAIWAICSTDTGSMWRVRTSGCCRLVILECVDCLLLYERWKITCFMFLSTPTHVR